MLYWLYTSFLPASKALLVPLLCLAPFLLVATAIALGSGIGRGLENDEIPVFTKVLSRITFLVVNGLTILIYLSVTQNMAIQRHTGKPALSNAWVNLLVGGPATVSQAQLIQMGTLLFMALCTINVAVYLMLIRRNAVLREWIDGLRAPTVRRGAMGSATFCSFREFRRYRRPDPEGITFLGKFYNDQKYRLDWGSSKMCLSSEDAARGILTIGGPGSGKTQAIILPVIADRMYAQHSLIVADPQGEITGYVLEFAKATGHLVVVHDPTSTTGPRYNLAQGIKNVSDATAIAGVLIASDPGINDFWVINAKMLLGACLLRFSNLGDTLLALRNPKTLAEKLSVKDDDAATLANSFIANVVSSQDAKMAGSIIATLATSLEGWADATVRANTAVSDFSAELLVEQPTVVVLTCPGAKRDVYARYLGATLRRLMIDLDTIGEQNRDAKRPGALPVPVGIILDEFPTLGKLDSLVKDVNLVRKRRLSILIGAQTKGQFEAIYSKEGTQTLFTGLATQFIFGGCDPDTAKYYSEASGTSTADANLDPQKTNMRARPLLTPDEIMKPLKGNLTVFARYVEERYSAQVIFTAQLTRFYQRRDWKRRLESKRGGQPHLLYRPRDIEWPPTFEKQARQGAPRRDKSVDEPVYTTDTSDSVPGPVDSTMEATPDVATLLAAVDKGITPRVSPMALQRPGFTTPSEALAMILAVDSMKQKSQSMSF